MTTIHNWIAIGHRKNKLKNKIKLKAKVNMEKSIHSALYFSSRRDNIDKMNAPFRAVL